VSGDPELAAIMAKINPPAPVEKIVGTDHLATAINRDKLGPRMARRIVNLECGHQTVTVNRHRAPCARCHRMILEGYDYHAFRVLQTIRDPIEDAA
jgi:hypothetical protein